MKSFFRMSYPYILWIGVFIVAPMLMILLYAVTRSSSGAITFSFTLDNFSRFVSDPMFGKAMGNSLLIAFLTTVFCILIGYPAALFIAGLSEKWQTMMILLLTLPMWINMLLKTYAWRGFLMNFGDLDTAVKVFLVMVYDFLPYMILQIHTAISKLDPNLKTAAHDLGATPWKTFLKVTLPLSVPGIISGITLVFLPAVSSFVIPNLLSEGKYMMIGNMIENYFLVAGDWNLGSAISLILALIIIASMYLTRKLDRSPEEE